MYNYILRRWVENRATREEVEQMSPMFLTLKEVTIIISTPQNDVE